jgi:type IV pilus assembly protein PilB
MPILDTQLYRFISDSGLVSRQDLDDAQTDSRTSGKKLGDILVTAGKITGDQLRRMHAHILGIPWVDLTSQKVSIETLSYIPEPIARGHNIVAFKKIDTSLEVAVLDVSDLAAIDFLKKKTNLKILPRLTDTESIKHVLVHYQKQLKQQFGDLIIKGVDAFDTLIRHATLQYASHIHLEPTSDHALIRYRIQSVLYDALVVPQSVGLSIGERIKTLASLKPDGQHVSREGSFVMNVDDRTLSIRVSTIPVVQGEKILLHLSYKNTAGYSLESLGFHGHGLEHVHHALSRSPGLILVTGPARSGKTTTLYTILDVLNTPNVSISTIENPIEYQMPRINQTQVRPEETGFSFTHGIYAVMSQDPDIIMVGDVPDGEVATQVVNGALTGRLVLAGVDAQSSARALSCLINMKIDQPSLASTLSVIINQRLVRRLSHSKKSYTLSSTELKELEKQIDTTRVLEALKREQIIKPHHTWKDILFYQSVLGIGHDGWSEQIGIQEVLCVTPMIKDMIIRSATSAEIETQARKEGMLTILEDGIFKCVQGLTTIEEVLGVVAE